MSQQVDLLIPNTICSITSTETMNDQHMSIQDAFDLCMPNNTDDYVVNAARIDGSYDNYLKIMQKKHKDKKRELLGNIIVIDSYDGAEHHRRQNKKTVLYHSVRKCFLQEH